MSPRTILIHIPNIFIQRISKDLKTNPLSLSDTELVVQWSVAAMLSGRCLIEAKYGKSLIQTRKYLEEELAMHMEDIKNE